MGDKTGIGWTNATWNWALGCTQIPGPHGAPSGCDNCYAKYRELDTRQRANPKSVRYGLPFEVVTTHQDRMTIPMRWTAPKLIFVNSLSDVFHIDISDSWIDQMLAVMAICPQHRFQVLTKRPERMGRYLRGVRNSQGGAARIMLALGQITAVAEKQCGRKPNLDDVETVRAWIADGMPNVWWGTSVCTNVDAWRADQLREVPSDNRFLSLEPLLGPVDAVKFDGIGWVIAGGESGSDRIMQIEWARDIRDRCKAAGIPFFFKQWGDWTPNFGTAREEKYLDGNFYGKVGKKEAGNVLDGELHEAFPPGLTLAGAMT